MAVTSLLLCSTVTLYSASGPLAVTPLPRGPCALCCRPDPYSDIKFLLYTRRNPRVGFRLSPGSLGDLLRSPLRPNASTVIYLHGFTEVAAGRSSQTIKTVFLERGDYNVILVDWSPLSAAPWYHAAAAGARLVGQHLARFVRFLHRHAVHVSYLHVVGFSLGAEAAGFAGKALTDIPLPRITGLDPAFPLYMSRGRRGHLASSDARLVDVIHTDGGVFGFSRPLGHVDFYPNGGVPFQPGCRLRELLSQRRLSGYIACSHNRAWAFFAESVARPGAFPAVRCPSLAAFTRGQCPPSPANATQFMGLGVDPSQRGMFYLRTRDRPPYSLQGPEIGKERKHYILQVPEPESYRPHYSLEGPEPERDWLPYNLEGLEPGSYRPPYSLEGPEIESDTTPYNLQGPEPESNRPPYSLQGPELERDRPPYSLQGPEPERDATPYSLQGPEIERDTTPYNLQGPEPERNRPPYSLQGPEPERDVTPYGLQGPEPERDATPYSLQGPELERDIPPYSLQGLEPERDTPPYSLQGPESEPDCQIVTKYSLIS